MLSKMDKDFVKEEIWSCRSNGL